MSSPYRTPCGNSSSSRNSQDYSSEFNNSGDPPLILPTPKNSNGKATVEPVTPPASIDSHSNQTKLQYLSQTRPKLKAQFSSPSITVRDQRQNSSSNVQYNTASLASPMDMPRSGNMGYVGGSTGYVPPNGPATGSGGLSRHAHSHSQGHLDSQGHLGASHLTTPHTPFMAAGNMTSNMSAVPGTPIGANVLMWPVARNNVANNAVTTGGVSGGTAPPSHSRSYSYNFFDVPPNLKRMSISSTSSSGSQDSLRPRAYSLGLASSSVNPGPFGGPMTQSSSQNASAAMDHAGASAFPPPLSSPVSAEGIGASVGTNINLGNSGIGPGGMLSHRGSFPHAFVHPLTTEDRTGHSQSLHRSLSSVSTGFPPEVASLTTRRASPPQARNHGKSRRSSSGASSIDLNGSAGAATGTGTSVSGIVGSTRGTKVSPVELGGSTALGSVPRTKSSSSMGSPTSPAAFTSNSSNASTGSNSSGSGSNFPNYNVDIAQSTDEQIYALCRDQRGCRFLQRKLAECDAHTIHRVFSATHTHVVSLMMDPFGNYFCQKLFENCNEEEITKLLTVSAPSLPSVAVNQHGTRALQKLIDAVTTPEQVDILVCALNGHVVSLIRDLNGNHVVQKLLLNLNERGSQFIYDAACLSVFEIGSHRHGCCVLQRCLDYANPQNRQNLIAHIVAQAPALVCDPFGNYVCQYVTDLGVQEYTDSLVQQLLGRICTLSTQKFSSNVVEKCLRTASPPLQRALLAEVMEPKTFHDLLLDNYGNYVIQTALESTGSLDMETKHHLSASIQSALTSTRSPYGRRIMSKLKAW